MIITDPLVAFLFLLLLFVVFYLAARMAIADSSKRTSFVCNATNDGGILRFELACLGPVVPFDVAIRWADDPKGEPIARAPFVSPLLPFSWQIAGDAPATASSDTSIRKAAPRWLAVEWRGMPDAWDRRVDRVAVLQAGGIPR